MAESDQQALLVRLTANIAAAYVGANSLPAGDLPGLIQVIYGGLVGEAHGDAGANRSPRRLRSASRSPLITSSALEDGLKFKSLRRHLGTNHGLSPEAYRTKWGLPKTYPMVAPAYAAMRSQLAKAMGLGQGGNSSKAGQEDAAGQGLDGWG